MFAAHLPALRALRSYSTASTAPNVSALGVVGAGQMGLGIALVASKVAQVPVTIVDTNQASIDKSLNFMGTPSPPFRHRNC